MATKRPINPATISYKMEKNVAIKSHRFDESLPEYIMMKKMVIGIDSFVFSEARKSFVEAVRLHLKRADEKNQMFFLIRSENKANKTFRIHRVKEANPNMMGRKRTSAK